MRLTRGGNLLLGTTTDAGFRLDVNGTARVSGNTTITPPTLTGSEATSAVNIAQTWNTTGTPTALSLNITDTASNSASILMTLQLNGSNIFRFRKDGIFSFGSSAGASIRSSNGQPFDLRSEASGSSNDFVLQNGALGSRNHTSGNASLISSNIGFVPTSGTAGYFVFHYFGIINQTGGANGTTRGIYLSPVLTSAADWRSIEWNNNIGRGLWGTGSANNAMAGALNVGVATNANASAILEATSTTKGFLPPRMTTTEKTTIASPATGLVVYDTTLNKLSVYTGATWETVTSV
jgi:hypothetical protein